MPTAVRGLFRLALSQDEPVFDLDAIDAYEAEAAAHDKRVDKLAAEFVKVAMRQRSPSTATWRSRGWLGPMMTYRS